jgi:hypothetical protein
MLYALAFLIFVLQGRISSEMREAGLEDWFWLHNAEAAAALTPRYLGLMGLSRQSLAGIRDYFGSEIAWSMLLSNFLARWLLVPAAASVGYSYVIYFILSPLIILVSFHFNLISK